MASPAIHPTRQSGFIDPKRPGDYPIILGDSLKGDASSKFKDALVNIRYNWQPKAGFGSRKSRLTKSGDKYELVVKDGDGDDDDGGGDFQYAGSLNAQPASGNSSDQSTTGLALIWNKSKSAFVLESISASLDMNLKSGPGHPPKSARGLQQIPASGSQQPSADTTQSNATIRTPAPVEDEPGDSSNPFDFRHFLAEARENLDKATTQQQAGNRTPLSGISTPVPPGTSRFVSTTPQFRATAAAPKTSSTTQQRKKKEEVSSRGSGHARTTSSTNAKNTASASKRTTVSKPLSKATISDSDSDADGETIDVARIPLSKPSRASTTSGRAKHPSSKGHARNSSANIGSSPHIIINDDDGGLEIDMGSPEPEDDRRHRRNRVDPEMFRSHTGTPIGGLSSNLGSNSRPLSRLGGDEARLKDRTSGGAGGRGRDRNGDVSMKDIEAESSPSDEDGDVEEFELGSPQEKRPSLPDSSRIRNARESDGDEAAPTPPAPRPDSRMQLDEEDDDDEDLLAAELEAALEEEDEAAAGIGLGIGMHHQQRQDSDESEVSEEE